MIFRWHKDPCTWDMQCWIENDAAFDMDNRMIALPALNFQDLEFAQVQPGAQLPEPTIVIPYEVERWHSVGQSLIDFLWGEGLRPKAMNFTEEELKMRDSEIRRIEFHLADMRRLALK